MTQTFEGRKSLIESWFTLECDDVAEAAERFHKYGETFWSDLADLWRAAIETDGPLREATAGKDAALIQERDGDGDTCAVIVTFYEGKVKLATKALDCDDLHRDSDKSGFAAAAEALATIEAAILAAANEHARPGVATQLAEQAAAELESGAISASDPFDQGWAQGVADLGRYLADPSTASDEMRALVERLRHAEEVDHLIGLALDHMAGMKEAAG